MKNKIIWYLKQLLPLTYWSTYSESGKRKFTIWKMWFGRCYQIRTFNIEQN